MPQNTLAAIEQKVRRITRSPSPAQLSVADLDNYINTFIIYDFPEQLRTFKLRTQFTFYTQTGQDVYPTDILSFGGAPGAISNPLYNFQNKYLTIHDPIYVSGYQSFFSQSREQFFGIYPIVNSISSIGRTGNGIATNFAGQININQAFNPGNLNQKVSLLQNEVLFSSVDLNDNGTSLVDSPILDSITGIPTNFGLMYDPLNPPVLPLLLVAPYQLDPFFPANNFINYATGQFNITFTNAPGAGQAINSQTVPTVLTIPQALCFYNNQFILRPVPDQPYRVNFEADIRPTELLAANQVPDLEEWWQYIAVASAKKIFEDRMDFDSINMIAPLLNEYQRLVNRRTLVQYTNERTATIYTEQVSMGQSSGWGWGSSGPV